MPVKRKELEQFNARSYGFTEQVRHWDLPMHEGGLVMNAAVGPGKGHLLAPSREALFSSLLPC